MSEGTSEQVRNLVSPCVSVPTPFVQRRYEHTSRSHDWNVNLASCTHESVDALVGVGPCLITGRIRVHDFTGMSDLVVIEYG